MYDLLQPQGVLLVDVSSLDSLTPVIPLEPCSTLPQPQSLPQLFFVNPEQNPPQPH